MQPLDYAKHYSSLSDDDLLRLADDMASLVPLAREALESELEKRTKPELKRSTTPSTSGMQTVGGWLLFYCVAACIFMPIWMLTSLFNTPLWVWILLLPHSILTTGAGIFLWRRDPKGLSWARSSFLYFLGLALALALLLISVGGAEAIVPLGSCLPNIAWWLYFRKSVRVRALFGQNMRGVWPLFRPAKTARPTPRNTASPTSGTGFFRSFTLSARAEMIAASFKQLRNEQFDCNVHNIETLLGCAVPSDRRVLGGEADLALKGYQLWLFSQVAHRYVPLRELQEFTGLLVLAGWKDDREVVEAYCLEFHEYRNNYPEQIVHVAIPVANYIAPGSDLVAWTIVARIMPILTIGIQMVLAQEFNDKQELPLLRQQLQEAQLAARGIGGQ